MYKYFKHYDIEDKIRCGKLDRILWNDTEAKNKLVKRKFFENHKFVFALLPEKEAELLQYYYGLRDGDFHSFEEIGNEYGVTGENVRRLVRRVFHLLKKPMPYKLLGYYDDDQIGYNEETAENYDIDKLEKIYKEILAKEEKERKAFLELRLKNDLLKNTLLDYIMDKRYSKYFTMPKKYKGSACIDLERATLAQVLNLSEEQRESKELMGIEDKIHSVGLMFFDEADLELGWRLATIDKIKEVGFDKFKKKLGFNILGANDFYSILSKNIKVMNFSERTDNMLREDGVETLSDLVRYKVKDFRFVKGIGVKSLSEIVSKLRSIGLGLCPEDCTPEEWIQELKLGYGKPVEDIHKKIIEEDRPLTKEEKFDRFMKKSVKELDFSYRATNCLLRGGLDNLGKVLLSSREDIRSIKTVGVVVEQEIVNKVENMGYHLRPEDIKREYWMDYLKQKYIKELKEQDMKKEVDLSGNDLLPEGFKEYFIPKKIYKSLMKRPVWEANIDRKMRGVEAVGYTLPRLKVEIGDDEGEGNNGAAFLALESDLNNLYLLEPDFITFFKDEICCMISNSKLISITEKVELLGYVSSIQDQKQEQEKSL